MPRRLRVVFDHQCFAFQRYGGISAFVLSLCQALQRRADIQPVLWRPWHISRYPRPPGLSDGGGGDRSFVPFPGAALTCARWGRMHAAWRRLMAGCDIAHPTYYDPPLPGSGPTVLTVHDCTHERFPQAAPSAVFEVARKRAALHRAQHIVCISTQTRDDIVQFHGIDPGRISVIPHGRMGLRAPKGPPPSMPGGRYHALYIGERCGYKNVGRAIAAVEAARREDTRWRLVLFGGGSPAAEERLLLDRRLSPAGWTWSEGDDRAMVSHYGHATCLLYPSRFEGFGMPVIDAMDHGCPVITSGCGALAETGGDAALRADPDITDEWTVAMRRCTDYDQRASIVAAGHRWAERFSWDRAAAAYSEVYHRVVR
jgi:glycosyltransferase involved in cell wall biosynthesis